MLAAAECVVSDTRPRTEPTARGYVAKSFEVRAPGGPTTHPLPVLYVRCQLTRGVLLILYDILAGGVKCRRGLPLP